VPLVIIFGNLSALGFYAFVHYEIKILNLVSRLVSSIFIGMHLKKNMYILKRENYVCNHISYQNLKDDMIKFYQ